MQIAIPHNGAEGNRITLSAAPGQRGNVTIDGQQTYGGIMMENFNDWIIQDIRFVNHNVSAIVSWTSANYLYVDDMPANGLSERCIVRRCYFNNIRNTYPQAASNTSAIHYWGTRDWEIYDNEIDDVKKGGWGSEIDNANGIQTYGAVNPHVHHNTIRLPLAKRWCAS
jgi:hypothetical protein